MLITEWKSVTTVEALIICWATRWFPSLNEWERNFFDSLRVEVIGEDEGPEGSNRLSHRQRVTLWNIAIRHQYEVPQVYCYDTWPSISCHVNTIETYKESLRVVIQQDREAA